jgi:hypothetical protein
MFGAQPVHEQVCFCTVGWPRLGSTTGVESLTAPGYKSVRGFHASSLLMPPPPTYTPASRSLRWGGFVDGFILFLRYIYVFFFFVLFAKLHKYNDTLATSSAQRHCHRSPMLWSVRLVFGKSWVRARKLHVDVGASARRGPGTGFEYVQMLTISMARTS